MLCMCIIAACNKTYRIPLSTNDVVFESKKDSITIHCLENHTFSDFYIQDIHEISQSGEMGDYYLRNYGWISIKAPYNGEPNYLTLYVDENKSGIQRNVIINIYSNGPSIGFAKVNVTQKAK